jgi:hypothetical protein
VEFEAQSFSELFFFPCFPLLKLRINFPSQHVHINQISNASEDNDKCVLLNHQIPNITYSGGGTNTYSALLKAKVVHSNPRNTFCSNSLKPFPGNLRKSETKNLQEDSRSDHRWIFKRSQSDSNRPGAQNQWRFDLHRRHQFRKLRRTSVHQQQTC